MKKWLINIRIFIGNYFLQKDLAKRKRKITVCNIEKANSIGILYKVENEKNYQGIKDYVKWLKEEGVKQVLALGYVEQKELPSYLQHQLSFDFFSSQDLNWYMKPTGNTIANFVTTDYDILIDLSHEECFPVKYALGKSRAKFKVGKYSKKKEPLYDMMIDVKEVKSLRFLVEQITHYLTIINK